MPMPILMPPPPPRRRHPCRAGGFTLLELMLSMALGLIVLLTAFAAVRVASQCYTITNRLSMENGLLRIGFLNALDEIDFWRSYDDPFDPTQAYALPNGGEVNRNPGLPFAPFNGAQVQAGFRANNGTVPPQPTASSSGHIDTAIPATSETSYTGWMPSYAWSVSDPAVWCRMNFGERCWSNELFGFYCQFSGACQGTRAPSFTAGLLGAVQPPHTWLSSQMDGLKNTIGYYGMFDYLPANTIYSYNTTSSPVGEGNDYVSYEFGQPNGAVDGYGRGTCNFLSDGDGGTAVPRGLYRESKDVSIGVFPTNVVAMYPPMRGNTATTIPGEWTTAAQVSDNLRRFYTTGQNTTPTFAQVFQNSVLATAPLMPVKPDYWPAVTTSVERFVCYDRFVAVCHVTWSSPLTGQRVDLSFAGFGTSLRGARQQRAPSPGAGWASWDNANGPLAPVASANNPTASTLDTQ